MRVLPGRGAGRAIQERLYDRLLQRAGAGAKLGLARVSEALALVGSPHLQLAVVHVAGTNGKGSTCALIESIARQAGLRTGFYSSPHLSRFNERIRLAGTPIDDDAFTTVLARALADDLPQLSFFETLTVAALSAMANAGVELAILEVGLGGRLDATNVVVQPWLTVITCIGQDHTHMLGSSPAEIAAEKAGILKRGVPALIGPVSGEAAATIWARAAEVGCGPRWQLVRSAAEHLAVVQGGQEAPLALQLDPEGQAEVRAPDGRRATLAPALTGAHQLDNAALAAGAAWLLAQRLPRLAEHIEAGLAAARWPGRLEALPYQHRTVLLDCAHNAHAMRALVAHLDAAPTKPAALVFGAMAGKPWPHMLALLAALVRTRIYCEAMAPMAGRRAVPPAELAAHIPGSPAGSPEQAMALAIAQTVPGQTVLVTGSIFLVGRVRATLLDEARDVVVPL